MCRRPDQVPKRAGIKKSWIGLPCFRSIAGKMCIGRDGDFFPDFGAETEVFWDLTRIVRELRGTGRTIEGMVNADGTKKRNTIISVCSVFRQRVLAESALRIRPVVDQPPPAFISPGTRTESNVVRSIDMGV